MSREGSLIEGVAVPKLLGIAHGIEAHLLRCVAIEVDVWCLRVANLDPAILADAAGLGLLAEDERARHGRFHFQRDRDLYLAKRLLVRGALSEYSERPAAAWRFVVGELGRPAIAPECEVGELQFNLSGSRGLAVCAVARGGLLGVDVEERGRAVSVELFERVLAMGERERLVAIPESERGGAFLEYWTLKEAYVKARGLGLTLPVDQLIFDYERMGGIAVRFGAGIEDDAGMWSFEQMRVLERWVVAVARHR